MLLELLASIFYLAASLLFPHLLFCRKTPDQAIPWNLSNPGIKPPTINLLIRHTRGGVPIGDRKGLENFHVLPKFPGLSYGFRQKARLGRAIIWVKKPERFTGGGPGAGGRIV